MRSGGDWPWRGRGPALHVWGQHGRVAHPFPNVPNGAPKGLVVRLRAPHKLHDPGKLAKPVVGLPKVLEVLVNNNGQLDDVVIRAHPHYKPFFLTNPPPLTPLQGVFLQLLLHLSKSMLEH